MSTLNWYENLKLHSTEVRLQVYEPGLNIFKNLEVRVSSGTA
jgi:hypothetical protein